MSTALSSTELPRHWAASLSDLRSLLRFRSASLDARGRRRLRVAGVAVLALTLAFSVIPAYSHGARTGAEVGRLFAILPTIYLGVLVLSVISAAASGGGRELVPRDQAVSFPISSTTDHLGALLLAPLNIAWLLQAWTLLGLTAYVAGPRLLWATELPVMLWLVTATATGQVVAWVLEFVRRGAHGALVVRGLVGVLGAGLAALVITGRLTAVLDRSPTVHVLVAALNGSTGAWGAWAARVGPLLILAVTAVLAGAVPAAWASHRAPREEHRLESGIYTPRPDALSDLRATIRIDRVGIWRSLPLRRGLVVLSVMPGLIAFGGHLGWERLTILPGLVASGAALLFGVNTWCLDGRGSLWRESLPVSPGIAFASRVWVLSEVLLGSALLTIVLAVARAGIPTLSQAVALVCTTAVVAAQVVSASMRWSVTKPFSVDMRSARATPAPPVVMVGYSTRLALATTMVGLLFSALGGTPGWHLTLLIGLLLLLISAYRIVRTSRRWADPVARARVAVTVAG